MQKKSSNRNWLLWLLPTPGNIIFTLLFVTGLFYAQNTGAMSLPFDTATDATASPIAYQGHLTDFNGEPVSGNKSITFNLYNQLTGGSLLWTEVHPGVQLDTGYFSVMLGSIAPLDKAMMTDNGQLYLGVKVGTNSEISPRIELGSVPYAVHATTVSDGSITSDKLANGAVTQDKLSSDLDFAVIQSGWQNGNQSDPEWDLDEGSDTREYEVYVPFERSFTHTPKVMVTLNTIEADTSVHTRISVFAKETTLDGFTLVFGTWGDSKIYNIDATWFAFTSH